MTETVARETLDAPDVPCIVCERTICGEPHWFGEAGPLCGSCYHARWVEFTAALMTHMASGGPLGAEFEVDWESLYEP